MTATRGRLFLDYPELEVGPWDTYGVMVTRRGKLGSMVKVKSAARVPASAPGLHTSSCMHTRLLSPEAGFRFLHLSPAPAPPLLISSSSAMEVPREEDKMGEQQSVLRLSVGLQGLLCSSPGLGEARVMFSPTQLPMVSTVLILFSGCCVLCMGRGEQGLQRAKMGADSGWRDDFLSVCPPPGTID
ncbi:hypothetical protein CB1_000613004 [Camelus ferus]|nr:hypothetical protein CB1_000613004 [Camelus ferus]